MKITGPGSGLPPEAAGATPKTKGPAGKEFADKLEKPGGAEKPTGAAGVQPASAATASAVTMVGDISADLRAGKITPRAAVDQVIDRILDKQLGKDAPPPVRESVGAALRDALESDPLLIEKVRGLGA